MHPIQGRNACNNRYQTMLTQKHKSLLLAPDRTEQHPIVTAYHLVIESPELSDMWKDLRENLYFLSPNTEEDYLQEVRPQLCLNPVSSASSKSESGSFIQRH